MLKLCNAMLPLLVLLLSQRCFAAPPCSNCAELDDDRLSNGPSDVIESMENEAGDEPANTDDQNAEEDARLEENLRVSGPGPRDGLKSLEIRAKELYLREQVVTTILRTLRSYGYQPEQLSNRTIHRDDLPKPLEDAVAGIRNPLEQDPNEEDEEEEEEDSEAKSFVHLKAVAGRPNVFDLDLQNTKVNSSASALLFVQIGRDIRKLTVYERHGDRPVKVTMKRLTYAEQNNWARLSISARTMQKWKQYGNSTVRLEMHFETLSTAQPHKCQPPYIMVSLLPLERPTPNRRFRRNANCAVAGHFINLRSLLGFTTFPEGATFVYCTGTCSTLERDHSVGNALMNNAASSGAIPHTKACCVPKEYEPFSLLVLLDSRAQQVNMYDHTFVIRNSNTRIVKVDIPRLVAKHCGCV